MKQKRSKTQQQYVGQFNYKSFDRENFSKIGKICDNKFYQVGKDVKVQSPNKKLQFKKKQKSLRQSYGFCSISRQKNTNYRFASKKSQGQLIYRPKYFQGKHHSPSWSFSKNQKHQKNKIIQYQLCVKHPFFHKNSKFSQQDITLFNNKTQKNLIKNQTNIFKNTQAQTTQHFIQSSKNNSNVDLYCNSLNNYNVKTKISNSFYLTKQQLLDKEQKSQNMVKNIKNMKKKYTNFFKRQLRKSNDVSKGFEKCTPNYDHQNQFNNYFLKRYPTKPQYHINFDKQTKRPSKIKQTNPSDMSTYSIDFSRKNNRNTNLYFSKSIKEIKTRYDRVQSQPNTRIDYDPPKQRLCGTINFAKMKGRSSLLQSSKDRYVKKVGNEQIQQKIKEINLIMK